MNPDDPVILIVVFSGGAHVPVRLVASTAAKIMNAWSTCCENIRNGVNVEKSRALLSYGAEVAQYEGMTYATWAWADVVGMYMRPLTVPEGEEWKYGG